MVVKCSNIQCPYTERIEGNFCPECGSKTVELDFKETTKLMQAKRKYQEPPKVKTTPLEGKGKPIAKWTIKTIIKWVVILGWIFGSLFWLVLFFPIGILCLIISPGIVKGMWNW